MSKALNKETIREIKAICVEKMHQIQTEIERIEKNKLTWWPKMLKTFSKEQIRGHACFFEEIEAIGVGKMHQILTKIDKNTKNFKF